MTWQQRLTHPVYPFQNNDICVVFPTDVWQTWPDFMPGRESVGTGVDLLWINGSKSCSSQGALFVSSLFPHQGFPRVWQLQRLLVAASGSSGYTHLKLLYSIPSYTESFNVSMTSTHKSTSSFGNPICDVDKLTILSLIFIFSYTFKYSASLQRP